MFFLCLRFSSETVNLFYSLYPEFKNDKALLTVTTQFNCCRCTFVATSANNCFGIRAYDFPTFCSLFIVLRF